MSESGSLSNRRFPREQEGFQRALSVPEGEVPCCGSYFAAHGFNLADFRGSPPGECPPHRDRNWVEWETSPAESAETTVFTWIGGNLVRPALRPAFPYVAAALFVDGVKRLTFPLRTGGFSVAQDGFALRFEPRRFQSLVEEGHRVWAPHGLSGFYRLTVPPEHLKQGQPLRLRVELPPSQPDAECFFYVSPRRDALKVDLAILRDEVARVQADLVQLRLSHEMLYAQLYPQLFPRRVKGKRVIALQEETHHLHPANVTVLSDGELVITVREATDHVSVDGRMVMVRSQDGGHTWGPKEVMYDLGNVDHRAAPIFELPNGDWVTTDYRAGVFYREDGTYDGTAIQGPSLWGAWSTDRGRTWQFSERPLVVPGMWAQYGEAERHMVRLPSGRLLVGANYCGGGADGETYDVSTIQIAVFCSDDNGRSWDYLSSVPFCPYVTGGEVTMLRTKRGKLLMLARSEGSFGEDWEQRGRMYQSVSRDDGLTWSQFQPTGLSSMSTPGHLLQLQDGRILCTHASRAYPGSIYITLSHDEGETWDTANTRIATNDLQNSDSTYPNSGQMADGTIITVWYANLFGKFYIAALLHRPEDL